MNEGTVIQFNKSSAHCKQTWNRNSVLRLERGKLTLVSENAHIKFQHHLKIFMRQFRDRSRS